MDRFITVAIHTYDRAVALRALLESQGVEVEFRNVNIEHPVVSSGVRVRIRENDLPLALRIIENREIFAEQPAVGRITDASRPLLVPVDFSDYSLEAAKVAFAIADKHRTGIILLHTYIDPYVAGNMQLTDSLTYEIADADSRKVIEETSRTRMSHFAARLRDMIKQGEIPPVKFETCVVEGVPEDAVNDFTKGNNPFLIVMGTRCSERKEREMIGSVTAEVLDKCRFSVLAIPESDKTSLLGSLSKILFFSNVDQEDILAMDTLHRLFPDANAKVTIANIPGKKRPFERKPDEALARLKAYCETNFRNFVFDTAALSLDKAVEDFNALEEGSGFDLIVVPNKKKNVFSRLFNPSLAHKILFAADIPMLVIPV